MQARKQGDARGVTPPRKISPTLEKCVGYSLKLLDIVQKIWAPQKTLCPYWCPTLVTGLLPCVSFYQTYCSIKLPLSIIIIAEAITNCIDSVTSQS